MINLQKMKEIREKKGLSQIALAKRVGISASFYCNIESGKKGCSTDTLAAICQVLEINIADIWNEDSGELPPILPIRDNGIVVESNVTRYVFPPTPETYEYIVNQVSIAGGSIDIDLKKIIEKWRRIDSHTKSKIMKILEESSE
jgi:putative transcriptional regulator